MTFGALSVTDLGVYFLFVNIFLFLALNCSLLTINFILFPLRAAFFSLGITVFSSRDCHSFLLGVYLFFTLQSYTFYHTLTNYFAKKARKKARSIFRG